MNKAVQKYFLLRRKSYTLLHPAKKQELRNWKMFSNKKYANDLINKYLVSESPCMIARFGSTEMLNLVNYIGVHNPNFKNHKTFTKVKLLLGGGSSHQSTNLKTGLDFSLQM